MQVKTPQARRELAEIRRSYGEGCLAAHALDLIGDRWTLLVARELMLGPRRFRDLAAGMPRIATNMLARRLAEMEGAGLLSREGRAYALTPAGESLWPVLAALCEVGRRLPGHDPRLPISPTALMLSMRCTLRPGVARKLTAAFLLDGREGFEATIEGGRLTTLRAARPEGDVRLTGPANLAAAAVYGAQPLAAMQGPLLIEGDLAAGQDFVDAFALRP